MRRLIVNPDTDSAWEVSLRSGVATLGRLDGNDVVLDHPSISDLHCEINVMSSGVTVKDLGSASGTFIGDEPVTESLLLPGQILRLGEVQLRLTDNTPAAAAARAVAKVFEPTVTTVTASTRCKYHPRNPPRFLCPKCHGNFCEMCVNMRLVGGESKTFCRSCAVECTPVEIKVEAREDVSFSRQIVGAFKYPFKGDGVILMCAGTFILLLVDGVRFVAKFAFIYGFIAVILLTIFGTGYLCAFLRRVITSTANGDEEMPEWPEIDDFASDVFAPFAQLIGTVVFCFAPTIGLTIYAMVGSGDGDSAWLGWATTASLLFGCVYFPMAFTAVAMTDTVIAVNPLVVIPSIMKVLRHYLLAVIVSAAIFLVRWLLYKLLVVILPIPVLPTIITSLIGLYLLVVDMRILGLLYRNNRDELGWV